MADGKTGFSLTTRPLAQAIRRSLRPALAPALVASSLISLLATPALAAQENHNAWSCRPSANGGWDCHEVSVAGKPYRRPNRADSPSSDTVAAAPVSGQHQPNNLDWVEAEDLSESQQAKIASGCCGTYVEPQRTDDEATLEPSQAPLRASADQSRLEKDSIAVLDGDVQLIQGYRSVATDHAELDKTTNQADLQGSIVMREPGLLLTGEKAHIDLNTGASTIDDAQYVIHSAKLRGEASRLEHSDDKVLLLEDGTFTRCEPESNAWYIKGSELSIDPETQVGSGKHVRLNVYGVPVFYTPYLQFPAGDQRKSGLLFPSISNSDDNGLDVAVPYYFNLAPNYDMTLTPRYVQERGAMLEGEARHLSQHFATTIGGAFLGSDDGGSDERLEQLVEDGTITAEQATPYEGEDRWVGSLQQDGRGQHWSSRIDYTKVSDRDYFRDLDTTGLEINSQTHLQQLAQANYQLKHWNLGIIAQQYQTIAHNTAEPYQLLPRLNANGRYDFGKWQLSLNNEYSNFEHRDDYHRRLDRGADPAHSFDDDFVENLNDPRITGERLRTDYSLSWNQQWIWGYIKPSIALKTLNYQLDSSGLKAGADDSPSLTVPQASLDMGLFFERQGSFFGSGYQQTFEPRLYYFYSEYESHDELLDLTVNNRYIDFDTNDLTFSYNQLFRDTRFAGGDRIDDADQLSVGLTSRFIETASGIERLRLSLGQISYFADRRVSLDGSREDVSHSDTAVQVAAQFGDHWRLSSDLLYSDSDNQMSNGNFSLRYFDEQQRIFNLSYRFDRKAEVLDVNDDNNNGNTSDFLDRNIDQADASLIWPVAGNWSLIGRYNYDLTNKRDLDTILGLEYNSCCQRLRIVWRRWLDNDLHNQVSNALLEEDEGIFLEFQLKGLAGFGSKVSSFLNDGIVNYQRREEAQQPRGK